MRVLLVHRYYWPDVPTYAQMLRFLGQRLADDGHEVSVLCGPPTYNAAYQGARRPSREVVAGVRVNRIPLPPDRKDRPVARAVSMFVFACRFVLHAVFRRRCYDVITVTTIPPVVMGVTARIIQRLTGTPYVYHCMDLYPEVAELGSLIKSRPLLTLARRLDRANCRRAVRVIVLSDDMRDTLARRGLETANVEVINNFEIEDTTQPAGSPLMRKPPGKYRVLFAGNMGRFQGLEQLIDVTSTLAPEHPDLELVFVGSGARVAALKQRAGPLFGSTIRFLGHQPLGAVLRLMKSSDLAVVSLQPGVFRVAYPSKTMMYLKAGCRLLVIVEPESELARFVIAENLGVVCPPGDTGILAAQLRSEISRRPSDPEEQTRVQGICQDHFGRPAILGRWSELLRELERGSVGG